MTDDTHETESNGISRRGVLRGAGVAAIASMPVVTASAGAAETGMLDGPNGVHIAYGHDPKTSMNVGWTGGASTTSQVRYGETGGGDAGSTDLDTVASASVAPVPGRDAFAYTVHLTGLDPGTKYAYEVAMDGGTKGPFTFRTAPGSEQAFRVTAVGDHGIDDPLNEPQRPSTGDPITVVERAKTQLDEAERDGSYPGFHIGVGDLSYANGYPSTWELYFNEFEGLYAERPFMTTPGNHEAEPGTGLTQYDRRLNDLMPILDTDISARFERRWYDFDFGNTKFIAMNSTTDNCGDIGRAEEFIPLYDPRCSDPGGSQTYGEMQEEYLRETLREAEEDPDLKWTVVYFHGPLWTTSPDHAPREGLRERWGALFDEYDVDLVLHGDNHVWERSKPIADNPGTEHGEYGTTFVVNGTGGTSHYALGEGAEWLAHQTADHFGITQLDIDEHSIDVRYVVASTPDGDPGSSAVTSGPGEGSGEAVAPGDAVDSFSIVKDERGRPTQAELVDRVPESLDVSGTRHDDGSAFTAGGTNQVELEVTDASEAVEVRDAIPPQWDVVRDDDGTPFGDATRTEVGDGVQYVHFDAGPMESGTVTYFAEAPERVEQSNAYTFGPCEARVPGGEWTTVAGTTSDEVVVGLHDGR